MIKTQYRAAVTLAAASALSLVYVGDKHAALWAVSTLACWALGAYLGAAAEELKSAALGVLSLASTGVGMAAFVIAFLLCW